jgi:hypothetical protein
MERPNSDNHLERTSGRGWRNRFQGGVGLFFASEFGNELTVALTIDDHLDHLVQQLGLAPPEPREILLHDREHIVLVLAGLACGMRRDEHVLHQPQRRGRGQRLLDHDVERSASDLPSRERVDERRLIDHAPARCVEKIRGRLHAADRIGIDQLLGFRRQRAGEGNEIGPRQQCVCGNCRRRPDIRLLLADVLITGVTSTASRLSEDAYRQVKPRLDLAVNDLDSTRTLLNPYTSRQSKFSPRKQGRSQALHESCRHFLGRWEQAILALTIFAVGA